MNELEFFGRYHQLSDLITEKLKKRNVLLDNLRNVIFSVQYKENQKIDLQGGIKIGSAWDFNETMLLQAAAAVLHGEVLQLIEEINQIAKRINKPILVLV